ncbi:hypothetical protein CONCODRAFT_13659 [Conidiobolus coronatus NRRL 28638]|uniref:Uncharacterized protein n=1 Tax=Conidiobolus coronatus (strain ATCC 28846 / CBS 209.66 / NRRL 28638) TaxID=796925 RepID=A0A137NQF2_CONC2|nr:hypothetical protein CONCODRAFT_13659 [Conidiobolus coronatus NRRL 28638]|eukprot:KXN64942.1 hypothetical protein CONCODRAFT_13659 [Conidiobolus coronatus NRRL 28638]
MIIANNLTFISAIEHEIPTETEDLAAAISSYTYYVYSICYPVYKYIPKIRIAK